MTEGQKIKGNLGRDADLRFTKNGTPVASFSIAHTPRRKNDKDEWEDAGETVWYRVTAWDDMATEAAEMLRKGMRVEVELTSAGVKDREYTKRDGTQGISRNECTAQRITLPDGTVLGFAPAQRVKAADTNPDNDPWASQADPWATPATDVPF